MKDIIIAVLSIMIVFLFCGCVTTTDAVKPSSLYVGIEKDGDSGDYVDEIQTKVSWKIENEKDSYPDVFSLGLDKNLDSGDSIDEVKAGFTWKFK